MKIVVVVDMQHDFITGSLGSAEAQEAAKNACHYLESCVCEDDIVYFTQDTHKENYLLTPEGQKLPVKHCIIGTEGWQVPEYLIAATAKHVRPIFVPKPTFGSHSLINHMERIITNQCVDEIVFMGVCTDICVISNVLMAKEMLKNAFEIPITVYANCCAGVTLEKHEAALEVMRSCQIDIKEEF